MLYLVLIVCIIGFLALAVLNPAVLEKLKGSASPRTKNQPGETSKVQKASVPEKFSYELRKSLFTPAEVRFYQALDAAMGEEYLIFAKVRVADILQPQGGCDRGTWQRAFNKISAKHFDFVICEKETLQLKCVIELDDSSHKQQDRARRDNFLNNAAQSAGLAIVRFPVRASYTAEQIQSKLSRVMD